MKEILRVLNVEDSEIDSRLLLRELERSDYVIEHERVETAEALTLALDRQSWDVLFCDFTMPQFSGQKALQIVNERNLDLPFIFVSGTVGEDVAVQAMKAGAHDYVMKDNLAQLVPAMDRALREAKLRSQRRQAEEDLRISEYKYRHLFESLGDAAFLIEKETGRILETNPQAEVLLGRPHSEILGMKQKEVFPPKNELAELPTGARQQRFESNVLQKNGARVPVYISLSEIELHDCRILLALIHDLSNRKFSEKKIQEQANLLQLAHDAIFVCTLDGKIQYWNKGAEQLYGWTAKEAIGGNFENTADEERASFEAAKEILLEKGCWSGEVRKLTKTHRAVLVASNWTLVRDEEGNRHSMLVIDTDITEKKQMEAHLLRAQRLELIGTLAGRIAHDLNNILQVIVTNIDLAMSAPALDWRLPKYLGDASQGANRAADLARRLLTFSKGGSPIKQSLDVAEILTPAVLVALNGSEIKPFFEFQRGLYPVIGDPIQLTQVIENVVMNACEAAPKKGELLVQAENVDEGNAASSDLPAGRYVKIQIADNGPGIPEDIRERIFEVCFTTKAHASGLGLATAKSIMQQHGGSVTIESLIGRGSVVSLLLPAAADQPGQLNDSLSSPVVKRPGRILVIDDDEMILSVIGSMLNMLGYECSVATEGIEGRDAYVRAQAEGNPFAAVLLDATIPNGLSGGEALKVLLEADPEARVILCSGYSDSDLFNKARQLGFKEVLAKPFSLSEFVSVFKKVLS